MYDNVYGLVAEFYKENHFAEDILPKEWVERYLRKRAWCGADDKDMRRIWSLVELLLTYLDEQQLDSFGSLSIFDYQEILYRYADAHENFVLQEGPVQAWLKMLKDFYTYLTEMGWQDNYEAFLNDVEESFYLDEVFSLPPRRTEEDFYHRLGTEYEEASESVTRLNEELDAVLKDVSAYFQRKEYSKDSERAVRIFCGPAYESPLPNAYEDDEQSAFWLSFWDYFMFDYHLLANDRTPLRHYYEERKNSLSITAQDILRDLLHARFSVFEVVEMREGMVQCRDIFTEELMDLPMPDVGLTGIENCVFFGHIRTRGILMLNYITSVPASKKLRSRMKDVIMRQYELYKLQNPQAPLEQFFIREAAAVRHILHVMSDYAQLNVVSLQESPALIERNQSLVSMFEEEAQALADIVRKIGFSAYATRLIKALFADAVSVTGDEKKCRELMAHLMTSTLLLFIKVNGYDYTATPDLYQLFGSNEQNTRVVSETLTKLLDLRIFDPRYLTEDSVVLSLYLLVQENKQDS